MRTAESAAEHRAEQRAEGVCRSAWSRAAALGAGGLAALQVATLVARPDTAAYVVVLLVAGALAAAAAGVGLGLCNCVVSRLLAAVVAGGSLAGVTLLVTVGGPGGAPVPPGGATWTALALGALVVASLAGDAARRDHGPNHVAGRAYPDKLGRWGPRFW